MTPRVLQPTELKHYWPEIKYGLEQVLRKTPTADWILEDVYAELLNRNSICVMGMKNEDVVGFFIGKPHDNGLFVWAGYCEENLDSGMDILINYAKSVDCNNITFTTDRKGWAKVAKKYGFRPSVWRLEI